MAKVSRQTLYNRQEELSDKCDYSELPIINTNIRSSKLRKNQVKTLKNFDILSLEFLSTLQKN